MAVKSCSLRIDMQEHEIDNRGTPMFPCGGYITSLDDHITKCVPWHWHKEVELMIVTSGILKLDVPNSTLTVKAGEVVFINSSVLHSAMAAGDSACELKSFVFAPKLVFGSTESAIEQKYVRPLVNCPKLNVIHFQNERGWHNEAIKNMEEAFACFQSESFGYEILVRDCLSKLWFLIVSNHQKEIEQHQNAKNTDAIRVKEMLGYIHAHYMESINLKNISDTVAISNRESLRCFNKVLGTTPMKYLLSYRVSVAAGLLANSDLNITEICRQSGFESPSYFSLKFKALTDMTPSEYKRQNRKMS